MNVKKGVIIQNSRDGIITCESNSEIPASILLWTDIALLVDCMLFFLS